MSKTNMDERGSGFALEGLKLMITLGSAILALTVTFIKDVIGAAREQATWVWLAPFGWLCLILSIWCALMAIVEAADTLGNATKIDYVFKSEKRTPSRRLDWLFQILAWFYPFIAAPEQNRKRKLAASAQNYFVLGLVLLGLFGFMNLRTAFRKPTAIPSITTEPQSAPPTSPVEGKPPATLLLFDAPIHLCRDRRKARHMQQKSQLEREENKLCDVTQ